MTYQAFYRVYRPQSFREMSGQAHVKRTLQNALLANKTTHAYLFSGPPVVQGKQVRLKSLRRP